MAGHHRSLAADSDSRSVVGDAGDHGQLGDFRLIRELGRGGMGVVYEAEQLSLGRHVALKVLPFAAMLDRQQLARFKNEARAAATLDHPHIVAIYSVGCERSVHYYAMQLIEGRSVADIIAAMKPGRPPSVEESAPTAALIKPPTADDTARARAAYGASHGQRCRFNHPSRQVARILSKCCETRHSGRRGPGPRTSTWHPAS